MFDTIDSSYSDTFLNSQFTSLINITTHNFTQDFPFERDADSDDLLPEHPRAEVLGAMATGEAYRESLLRLF